MNLNRPVDKTTPRVLLMIGVMSFCLWLFGNIGAGDFGGDFGDLFDMTWDIITMSVAVCSVFGYFLFTEPK